MDMHIARQPIFTATKQVYGYELLYRGAGNYRLGEVSGERATTSLLSTTFLIEGIEKVAGFKPCFINFTLDLLLKEVPLSFPKKQVVIEVLEDVPVTPELLKVCRKFVAEGYTLALDDFVYHYDLEPLIALAHIIKIDFRLTKGSDLDKTIYKLARHDVKLLAEKVETLQEFELALKLGFSYFQGYFFGKPELIKSKEIPSSKLNLMQLLAVVNKKSTTVKDLEQIFARDVGMTYKLLRYINSAYYFLQNKIESLSHAIVYLGEDGVKQFVVLLIVSEISIDKPPELIRLSIVRAKFCELLAKESKVWDDPSEIFLLGLFSFIDALLDTPMVTIMNRLPIAEEIKSALMGQRSLVASFLNATVAYENMQREQCQHALKILGVKQENLADYYFEAVQFAETVTAK